MFLTSTFLVHYGTLALVKTWFAATSPWANAHL
jgi:hypothetical protein